MVSELQPATNGPAGVTRPTVSLPPGVEFDVVQRAPLFRDLSVEQIDRFLTIGTARTIKAGEQFITEGSTETDTYLLLRGKVDIVKKLPPVLPGGAEQLKSLVQLTAPAMGIFAFGAPNMLGGLGRSASIVALEDCDAIVITKEAYEQLALEAPLLGYYLTRNIALEIIKNLNDTNQRVIKLTQALTLALQKRG